MWWTFAPSFSPCHYLRHVIRNLTDQRIPMLWPSLYYDLKKSKTPSSLYCQICGWFNSIIQQNDVLAVFGRCCCPDWSNLTKSFWSASIFSLLCECLTNRHYTKCGAARYMESRGIVKHNSRGTRDSFICWISLCSFVSNLYRAMRLL